MLKDRWLPIGFPLPHSARLRALLHAGPGWQIYQTDPPGRVLVAEPPLVSRWVSARLLEEGLISSIAFGQEKYSVLCSNTRYILVPIAESPSPESKAEALSLAVALRETRKITPDAPLQDAIFVEQYSRLLPTWSITERVPDDIVLGAWLTGGVAVSVLSFRRLSQLMGWMSPEHLRDIVTAAGFALPRDQTVGIPGTRSLSSLSAQPARPSEKTGGMESSELDSGEENPKRFVLPGRPQLEVFFNDHVIDIILHAERYQALGIDFPSAIVLHGPPGCGKTYAVEQLVEFMDWPCFSINSNTVGSPYIHETSRKISEVFDRAIDASPSVVVIDEMESYLSDRQISGSTGLHHVEEVAEFLRRIPEAAGEKVLIIGMTNRIDMIDPAILRRGRFDHVIEVGMPTRAESHSLLQSLLAKIPTADRLDIAPLAERLSGRPLSDAAFVIREAARLAAKSGKTCIDPTSLSAAWNALAAKDGRDGGPSPIGFL